MSVSVIQEPGWTATQWLLSGSATFIHLKISSCYSRWFFIMFSIDILSPQRLNLDFDNTPTSAYWHEYLTSGMLLPIDWILITLETRSGQKNSSSRSQVWFWLSKFNNALLISLHLLSSGGSKWPRLGWLLFKAYSLNNFPFVLECRTNRTCLQKLKVKENPVFEFHLGVRMTPRRTRGLNLMPYFVSMG